MRLAEIRVKGLEVFTSGNTKEKKNSYLIPTQAILVLGYVLQYYSCQ